MTHLVATHSSQVFRLSHKFLAGVEVVIKKTKAKPISREGTVASKVPMGLISHVTLLATKILAGE